MVQHSKGCNSHSQRLEARGKCFVHEIGEALGSSGFVAKEAGMLPGCREGVQLFPGVLRAAGKHLCGLQCSTVPFFYPETGCT